MSDKKSRAAMLRERAMARASTGDHLKREKTTTAIFEGDEVWMWELSGAERDKFESDRVKVEKGKTKLDYTNARAKLVALSMRESGDRGAARICIDGDFAWLGNYGAGELDRLYGIAAKLSGLRTGDEDDDPKNVSPPGDGSSTDSPPTSAGEASPGV
jgi:hypothetical protein